MSPSKRELAIERWRKFVHHIVHPLSGAIVLAAGGVELAEWVLETAERLSHFLELPPGSAGG